MTSGVCDMEIQQYGSSTIIKNDIKNIHGPLFQWYSSHTQYITLVFHAVVALLDQQDFIQRQEEHWKVSIQGKCTKEIIKDYYKILFQFAQESNQALEWPVQRGGGFTIPEGFYTEIGHGTECHDLVKGLELDPGLDLMISLRSGGIPQMKVELALLEILYRSIDTNYREFDNIYDSVEEVVCMMTMWRKVVQSAPAVCAIGLITLLHPHVDDVTVGIMSTWIRTVAEGWKHSPTIYHGLIQAALEKAEAPEHLQYIDDIFVWRDTAEEVLEKGKKIIQILLKAGFAIKQSKIKGPAKEIQFLGVKWQDGQRQIPTEVINKIVVKAPPTKEMQAFLGAIGFWRMRIAEYCQIVSPLYLVTHKKYNFHRGPEREQAFKQIKQDIACGPWNS
ncbi:hypothetical protein WISP_14225 [Willisornis vidua]|uniref:ribonuclease H n=1 Tax=Willisornis vidua TaxID=1566151 RepID=A0ABQ9DQC2_9PASS|nr:hypothetical protein WISP_14225 [Willisornis vidua]